MFRAVVHDKMLIGMWSGVPRQEEGLGGRRLGGLKGWDKVPGIKVYSLAAWIIFRERPRMTGSHWVERYRSISSERQRPISRMVRASTFMLNSAMAPAERRLRAETWSAVKPSCGPRKVTAALRTDEILREDSLVAEPWKKYVANGVVSAAWCVRRWMTRRTIERTGHRW